MTAKKMKSESYMMHGFDDSISIDLAPLSVIYLKPIPKPKVVRTVYVEKTKTAKKDKAAKKKSKK